MNARYSSNLQCNTDISGLNKEINPNTFPIKKYGQGHHIQTPQDSWSPSKELGMSPTSSWGKLNLFFSIWKIERSVKHQSISILQNKSIGALKITFGYYTWSQGCSLYIRNALSGIFLKYPVLHLYLRAKWRNQPQSFSK